MKFPFIILNNSQNTIQFNILSLAKTTLGWTKKKDFPGIPRCFGASFAHDGKGYYGLGSDLEYYNTDYTDFGEFDPVLNT